MGLKIQYTSDLLDSPENLFVGFVPTIFSKFPKGCEMIASLPVVTISPSISSGLSEK
jgi:hypothetical protein